jgi:5-methylcytosine-specific restriction enzyme subunit McrC
LAEHANGAPVFELRPDIVMGRADEVAFVIDTKWKRLQEDAHREGVTSADAYQMFAYAREYAAPSVTLLYPHHAALGAWVPQRAEYRLKGGSRQHIGVATVDLRNLGCVPAQLAGIFRVAEANLAVPANIEEISGLLCL